MKKHLILLTFLFSVGTSLAQVYTPITTTGYTLDAIAETTLASAHTGTAIDGSDYVMYSHAYGLLYSATATGLPDNGAITVGTRSYQLQPYTGANVFYIPAAQEDSLIFTTPAAYPAISILGMSTEGAGTMSVTVRFTDNTTEVFASKALPDWFNAAATAFYSGFDRCSRGTGALGNAGAYPKLYNVDIALTCTNTAKLIKNVKIRNTSATGPRFCIMAVSGAATGVYNIASTPASCINGTNGSASLTIVGGVAPFTYTWSSSFPQNGVNAFGLAAGDQTVTIKDAAGCITQTTVLVGVSPTALPPLSVSAATTIICAGKTTTLSVAGALSYTWAVNNATTSAISVTPGASTFYNVSGLNPAGCVVSGNILITVTPLPSLTFTSLPAVICENSPNLVLTADPAGGTFSGPGVNFNTLYTTSSGNGLKTIVYTYTDANGCTASTSNVLTIAVNTIAINFSFPSNALCSSASTLALNASPAGGTYYGAGVANGVFSPAMGVGTRTVSYTYADANGCSSKAIASTVVYQCNGINQLTAASAGLSVYPNPATSAVNIKSDVTIGLVVINELGQTVRSLKLDDLNGHQTVIENLSAGIYFVKSTDAAYSVQQKLVITK